MIATSNLFATVGSVHSPAMDTFRFEIIDDQRPEAARVAWPGDLRGLEFTINGVDLVELARAAELPFAEREGHPQIAGSYGPLLLYPLIRSPRYFLGEPVSEPDWPGWTELLVCAQCGASYCWPLLVQIEVGETTVTWRRFRQPHRGERTRAPGGAWTYDSLGPFVFDRTAYVTEIERLNSSFTANDHAFLEAFEERQRQTALVADSKGQQKQPTE